ncbi:MAG: AAA-like domain-containing protein [Cyanobacteria bacterium J06627_28]
MGAFPSRLSRSLKVHPSKLDWVNQTFMYKVAGTQKGFAEALEVSVDTVRKFLKGKAISRSNFQDFCEALELDWCEAAFVDGEAGAAPSTVSETVSKDIGVDNSPQSSACEQTANLRIFLSYNRSIRPDELVALDLHNALRQQHNIFIDQEMPIGTPWAETIKKEIFQADALIVLLSEQSAQSEMVQQEIALARESAALRQGLPLILPVRLCNTAPFRYPLNETLDPLQWAFWNSAEDTPRLIAEIQSALVGKSLPIETEAAKRKLLSQSSAGESAFGQVSGQASGQASGQLVMLPPDPMAQPPLEQVSEAISLERPEGTMDPNSQFYIQRQSDIVAMSALQQQNGGTVTILGPRQMGKSSLLFRTIATARAQNKKVIFLDFQQFESTTLEASDRFFQRFCAWLTRKVRLKNRVEAFWQENAGLDNPMRCTCYLEDYLLPEINQPIFLAMDEVDRLIKSPFRDSFFSMLRSWHNDRADFDSPWRQFDLVMVTSTEPYQLIQDMDQSPFNVGTSVGLRDFTLEEIAELNQRHGTPLSETALMTLMEWVNGHPYLTRKALFLVASGQMSAAEVFDQAVQSRGPFGGHLRYHLLRMEDKSPLVEGMLQVISHQSCKDEQVLRRLEGAGLVQRGEGRQVLPRCRLYAEYFGEHLRE